MEIVVSGASRGLGRAISFSLAPLASKIWLTASSNSDYLRDTAAQIEKQNSHLSIEKGSIQTAFFDSKELWAKGATNGLGALLKARGCSPDVLVNNAGGFALGKLGDSPDELQSMLSMNLFGPYELTRELLPALVEKRGQVINIASIAARSGIGYAMAYGVAKHGVAGFSKNLREELKGSGVRVTAVYPGTMDTARWQTLGAPGPKPVNGPEGKAVLLADDVADMIVATVKLSKGACVEEIVLDSA